MLQGPLYVAYEQPSAKDWAAEAVNSVILVFGAVFFEGNISFRTSLLSVVYQLRLWYPGFRLSLSSSVHINPTNLCCGLVSKGAMVRRLALLFD